MNVFYKILIILILLIIIKIFNKTNQDNFNNIDLKSLTEEERQKLREELMQQHTDVRFLAATDVEAILNVTNIIKNGSIPIPKGTIVAYNSTEPPNGWVLCDGNKDNEKKYNIKIPNLQRKFILGAEPNQIKGDFNFSNIPIHLFDQGGTNKIKIDNMPSHDHGGGSSHEHKITGFPRRGILKWTSGGSDNWWNGPGGYGDGGPQTLTKSTNKTTVKIPKEGGNEDYWQPYYALTYIMKV